MTELSNRRPSRNRKASMTPQVWAQTRLAREDAIILDVETTGLRGEVVQIGIIDVKGKTLFESRVKPVVLHMDPGAEEVHGISLAGLRDEKTMDQIWPELKDVVNNKLILAYNAEFDQNRFYHSLGMANVQIGYHLPMGWECVMLQYARFRGVHGRRGYKWHKLHAAARYHGIQVDKAHDAVGDCLTTLELLKVMAK